MLSRSLALSATLCSVLALPTWAADPSLTGLTGELTVVPKRIAEDNTWVEVNVTAAPGANAAAAGQVVRIATTYDAKQQPDPAVQIPLSRLELGKPVTVQVRPAKSGGLEFASAPGPVEFKGFSLPLKPQVQPALQEPDLSAVDGANIDETKVTVTLAVDAGAAGSDANPGTSEKPLKTFAAALTKARTLLAAGTGVRISLAPGIYREGEFDLRQGLGVPAGKTAPLLIEGRTGANGERVIFSGADPITTWQSTGNGVFTAPWSAKLGFWGGMMGKYHAQQPIRQRREVAVAGGKFLVPVMLDRVKYALRDGMKEAAAGQHGATGGKVNVDNVGFWTELGPRDPQVVLEPGTFGVSEGRGLVAVRFAEGQSPTTHPVEISTRRYWLAIGNVDQVAIRGLTLQHFATAIAAEDNWKLEGALCVAMHGGFDQGKHRARNITVEEVTIRENSGLGAQFGEVGGLTLRKLKLMDNGGGAAGGGAWRDAVIEDLEIAGNNWRGGTQTGWFAAGFKMHDCGDTIIRRFTAYSNLATGLWFDINCERVSIEDLTSVHNRRGLFVEISKGPFLVDRAFLADNQFSALRVLDVEHLTVRNSILVVGPQADAKPSAEKPIYDEATGKSKRDDRMLIDIPYYLRSSMTNDANWNRVEHALGAAKTHIEFALPGPWSISDSVVASYTPRQFLTWASLWLPQPQRLPAVYDRALSVTGTNFFAPETKAFLWFDFNQAPAEQPQTMDLDRFKSFLPKVAGTWTDPGFVNPSVGDYRLRDDAPMAAKAKDLPDRAIPAAWREKRLATFAFADRLQRLSPVEP
jgi:hypothetical protein